LKKMKNSIMPVLAIGVTFVAVYLVLDKYDIGFENNGFDAVFSMAAFEFIKEPQKFNFLMKISAEESPEVKNEIKRKYSLMSEKAYELLLKNIDLSNFRKDIDTEKAVNIILWFFDSYVNKTINKLREGIHDIGHFENDTLKEFNEYLEILSRLMTDA